MPEESVKSTGIKWIRYDEGARTLDVAYVNSGEYRYFDVGPEVYAWLSGDLEKLLQDSLRSPPGNER